MAVESVPTRIVIYGCRPWEPKYDAAYRLVGDTGRYVIVRKRKRRPVVCPVCGTGRKLRGGPLGYCESCSRHTLELQLKGVPPEKVKPAPVFRAKLSNRDKRRARLAGVAV